MEKPQKRKRTGWGIALTVDIIAAGVLIIISFSTANINILMMGVLTLIAGLPIAVVYRILRNRDRS